MSGVCVVNDASLASAGIMPFLSKVYQMWVFDPDWSKTSHQIWSECPSQRPIWLLQVGGESIQQLQPFSAASDYLE